MVPKIKGIIRVSRRLTEGESGSGERIGRRGSKGSISVLGEGEIKK